MHAEEIIGPNLGSLKVKTTRKTLENETINSCDLPDGMLAEHGNVTLAVDINVYRRCTIHNDYGLYG